MRVPWCGRLQHFHPKVSSCNPAHRTEEGPDLGVSCGLFGWSWGLELLLKGDEGGGLMLVQGGFWKKGYVT